MHEGIKFSIRQQEPKSNSNIQHLENALLVDQHYTTTNDD